MNSETRNCQNCKQPFTIEPEDFGFYEKMGTVPPISCPECRFRRRSVFRNEMTLYTRTCSKCGKRMISMYHPNSAHVVYCLECYESDSWDAFGYSAPYDPDKPFLAQFEDLFLKVPKQTLLLTSIATFVGSEYVNFAGPNLKNCYLIFNSGTCEDSMYSRGIKDCRGAVDSYYGTGLENCYETLNAQQSSRVFYSQNVVGCLESSFLLSCRNCQHCFGCVNMQNASYHFLNEPVSREEYQKKVGEIMGSWQKIEEFKKTFDRFALKFPRRQNNNIRAPGCVGDYLFDSHNLKQCYESSNSENCKYAYFNKETKDAYDITGYGYNSELLLEGAAVGKSQRVIASAFIESSHDIAYSFALRSSEYCLGCVGLKSGAYAILNRRYDKPEFLKIQNRIIAELKAEGSYGAFFPPRLGPFAYNEAIGSWNMPLTKTEALAEGFRWEDDVQMTTGKETLKSEQIPDHIQDVQDSITNEIFTCVSCRRNYKIIPAELEFYRQMGLPLPRSCFYCRHNNRVEKRGFFSTFYRICAKCSKTIETSYAPDRPEIVYCEECYQAEVA